MTRSQRLAQLGQTTQDLIVIGGGITGAGVAREAAWSGMDVVLVDSADFGGGTSSRSSKLLHGGLRYLEHYEFGLVFEAVRERMEGYRIATHLVEPLPFLFPQFEGDRPGMNIMGLGLWLYDAMAGFRSFGMHTRHNAEAFARMAPGIRTQGLRGGFRYFDAQTNDARLTLEAILDAQQLGANCLNYCGVVSAEQVGDLWCVKVEDKIGCAVHEIRARNVILAVGPWLDKIAPVFGDSTKRMRPTKGVHILVPKERFPLPETVVVLHPDDGRVMFAIPWETVVVIGTTDTDHEDPLLEPEVTAEDVAYALKGVNSLFPELHLEPSDVTTSYAGLRPLVDDTQQHEEHSESSVSREHAVFRIARSVYAIAGGKLTTWRVMASDALDPVRKNLKNEGRKVERSRKSLYKAQLPGGVGLKSRDDVWKMAKSLAEEIGSTPVAVRLATTYGVRAREIVDDFPDHLADIGQGLCLGMVLYSIREESACSVDDLLRRRTNIFYEAHDQGLGIAPLVADTAMAKLGWTQEERDRQLQNYIDICGHYNPNAHR